LTGIYNLAAELTSFSRFFVFFPAPRGLFNWHIEPPQSAHADYRFVRVFLFVARLTWTVLVEPGTWLAKRARRDF